MRSDKSSQMRVFYVGLIVEGVNEDITPGQELEEEIRQHGWRWGGERLEVLEGGRLRGAHDPQSVLPAKTARPTTTLSP